MSRTLFERMRNPYLRHAVGMTMIGLMMYAFLVGSGHYRIDGVGYSTIQEILVGGLAAAPFLALLFLSKLTATSVSLGSGSSGGIFSPSLFMGATIGGAFGARRRPGCHCPNITVPAFAMIGMAAMVGGGTGAAMTAIVMIFEMTRDYDIVMPMIIAVAVSIGIRRMLSEENIYTIKLARRKHFIPKAMHANMFLIRRAGEVMEKDFQLLPRGIGFDEFLRLPERDGTLRHIVVTDGERIAGTLRVNTSLRHGLEGAYTGVSLGSVASETFTIAHENDIMFDVIHRFSRLSPLGQLGEERDGFLKLVGGMKCHRVIVKCVERIGIPCAKHLFAATIGLFKESDPFGFSPDDLVRPPQFHHRVQQQQCVVGIRGRRCSQDRLEQRLRLVGCREFFIRDRQVVRRSQRLGMRRARFHFPQRERRLEQRHGFGVATHA